MDISELKIEHKLEPELQKETVVSTYLYLPVVMLVEQVDKKFIGVGGLKARLNLNLNLMLCYT